MLVLCCVPCDVGQSRLAGVFSALTIGISAFLLFPYFQHIPSPALLGVSLSVALRMLAGCGEFRKLWRMSRSSSAVYIGTGQLSIGLESVNGARKWRSRTSGSRCFMERNMI